MRQEPYKSAHRVFWIVDNGSSHYTTTFPKRLANAYDNAIAVHLPIQVGLTRLKSISLSYKERRSHPMTWQIRQAMQNRILGFQEQLSDGQTFQLALHKAGYERTDRATDLAA